MLIAACGETTPSTSATTSTASARSGVEGRVTACPVEPAGQPCLPAAAAGTVTATDRDGAASTTTTDAAGRYTLEVEPGVYTLRMIVDGPIPRCSEATVTVVSGSLATLNIDCDTGIR